MFTRFRTAAVICGVCAGLAAGCGGSGQSTPGTSAAAPAAQTQTAAAAQTAAAQTTAAAPTTAAAQTTTATQATSTTQTGAQIQVTPQMIATARVACGYVDRATGPLKSTLQQACGQLTSGDVSGAVATYNTICHKQAALGATAAEQAMLARACPTLVVH